MQTVKSKIELTKAHFDIETLSVWTFANDVFPILF